MDLPAVLRTFDEQVDAMPATRPVLERMGFHPLAEITPWVSSPL